MPTINKIMSWSISRLRDYRDCPRKAKYKHVDKMKDGGSAAMDRGAEIHTQAEMFVAGRVQELSPDLVKVKPLLEGLRKKFQAGQVFVEQELAFNPKWQPTSWFNMSGPMMAWVRIKMDLIEMVPKESMAIITDWKTGKYKPDGDYAEQLNLYAVGALLKRPELKKAVGQLIFTDHGAEPVRDPEGTLTRAQLPLALKKWEAETKQMLNDTAFKPKPGRQCSWCPFSRNKGGPCEF